MKTEVNGETAELPTTMWLSSSVCVCPGVGVGVRILYMIACMYIHDRMHIYKTQEVILASVQLTHVKMLTPLNTHTQTIGGSQYGYTLQS